MNPDAPNDGSGEVKSKQSLDAAGGGVSAAGAVAAGSAAVGGAASSIAQRDAQLRALALQPRGFPSLPADWQAETETFRSVDGQVQLFGILLRKEPWTAPPASGRALVVLHGFGDHAGRYLHFPHYLRAANGTAQGADGPANDPVDAIYGLDHRGHGRSEGLRGDVERFDAMADDAARAITRLDERLRGRFGKSEIHLFAHSMGSLVALRMMFAHPELPLASASLSAPFLAVKAKVSPFKTGAAKLLNRLGGGRIQLDTGLDADLISRDPEVVMAYRSDRLVHGKMTPRFFAALQEAQADTLRRESGIEPPLLFMVPQQDGLVDAEVSIDFFTRLKHRDKRLATYPGYFHEAMNDPGKEVFFADLGAWIRAHSQK